MCVCVACVYVHKGQSVYMHIIALKGAAMSMLDIKGLKSISEKNVLSLSHLICSQCKHPQTGIVLQGIYIKMLGMAWR